MKTMNTLNKCKQKQNKTMDTHENNDNTNMKQNNT